MQGQRVLVFTASVSCLFGELTVSWYLSWGSSGRIGVVMGLQCLYPAPSLFFTASYSSQSTALLPPLSHASCSS